MGNAHPTFYLKNIMSSNTEYSQFQDTSNPNLCQEITQRIQRSHQNRISFAEYMDLALYHPQYGYYARIGDTKIGTGGDFMTSPHLAVEFGSCLSKQIYELWKLLGKPEPFHLVEMGAGQGKLAVDILDYLQHQHPDLFSVLNFIIIEKSTAMRDLQKQKLEKWLDKISWSSWDEIEENSLVGCCFANELVDAFPVHQIVRQDGKLQEIYVTTNDSSEGSPFVSQIGEPSTPRLSEYLQWLGIDLESSNYPEGYCSEINLAALDWLATVAKKLQRGYLITIDYGHSTQRYYSPQRPQGTLQCYYQHRYHDNPYIHVGNQDITAHVNFTALQRHGDDCGLQTVGMTKQGIFLMALGIGDAIASLPATVGQDIQKLIERRHALHQLIDPSGMGNFGVLVQSKEAPSGKLTGLP